MKTIPQRSLDFLDSWLTLRSQWADMPGFSVAIMKDDKLVFDKSYGYANLDANEKLTPAHLFHIASHSKTFTATTILQLQEKGVLKIDDPVVMYLPWLKDHHDTRWNDVTIRHLLSHSAGVIRDGEDAEFWQLSVPFPDRDELHRQINQAELILEPNTRMKYSNFGYGLLGEIIETVSGQPYAQVIDQYILQPLALQNVTSDYDATTTMPQGYGRSAPSHDRLQIPHVTANALAAATGLCATASDTARFFSALRTGNGTLLSDQTKREMQRAQWPVKNEDEWYCLGLERKELNGRVLYGHSGGYPGAVTSSRLDPEDNFAVSVFTNCNDGAAAWISASVYTIIDTFGDQTPDEKLRAYEVRTSDLWGINEYVAIGSSLYHFRPNQWHPLAIRDELKQVDETTFTITSASGFESVGEKVIFAFDSSNKVNYVKDAGTIGTPTLNGEPIVTWK